MTDPLVVGVSSHQLRTAAVSCTAVQFLDDVTEECQIMVSAETLTQICHVQIKQAVPKGTVPIGKGSTQARKLKGNAKSGGGLRGLFK